jgi:hypothetical protein
LLIFSFQLVAHVVQKIFDLRVIRLTEQWRVGASVSYGHISS